MKLDEKVFLLALHSHGETPRKLIYSGTVAINHKRARYLLEKWLEKGWYDYGVTLDLGWLTSKGVSKAKEVLRDGRESKTIMSLFVFPNGMVAACDKEGQQIPKYQGEVGKMLLKALKALDEEGEVYLNYQGKLKGNEGIE